MVRAFIHHRVRDYAAWREVYDAFDAFQIDGGVRAEAVFRGLDDPNDVTVPHDFDDDAAARAFLGAPELREAIANGGGEGQPQVWLGTEAPD